MFEREISRLVSDESEMVEFSKRFSGVAEAPLCIFLRGDLGAGKTTWVRGFLRGLGQVGIVKSPTYTLVETYSDEQRVIYHFDLYRLHDPAELAFIGIREYFHERAIVLVEWPEKGDGFLPKPDITIRFETVDDKRQLFVQCLTEIGHNLYKKLSKLP